MYEYLANTTHKIPEISHRGSNLTKHENRLVLGCPNNPKITAVSFLISLKILPFNLVHVRHLTDY